MSMFGTMSIEGIRFTGWSQGSQGGVPSEESGQFTFPHAVEDAGKSTRI
jgi:hypothetical protein